MNKKFFKSIKKDLILKFNKLKLYSYLYKEEIHFTNKYFYDTSIDKLYKTLIKMGRNKKIEYIFFELKNLQLFLKQNNKENLLENNDLNNLEILINLEIKLIKLKLSLNYEFLNKNLDNPNIKKKYYNLTKNEIDNKIKNYENNYKINIDIKEFYSIFNTFFLSFNSNLTSPIKEYFDNEFRYLLPFFNDFFIKNIIINNMDYDLDYFRNLINVTDNIPCINLFFSEIIILVEVLEIFNNKEEWDINLISKFEEFEKSNLFNRLFKIKSYSRKLLIFVKEIYEFKNTFHMDKILNNSSIVIDPHIKEFFKKKKKIILNDFNIDNKESDLIKIIIKINYNITFFNSISIDYNIYDLWLNRSYFNQDLFIEEIEYYLNIVDSKLYNNQYKFLINAKLDYDNLKFLIDSNLIYNEFNTIDYKLLLISRFNFSLLFFDINFIFSRKFLENNLNNLFWKTLDIFKLPYLTKPLILTFRKYKLTDTLEKLLFEFINEDITNINFMAETIDKYLDNQSWINIFKKSMVYWIFQSENILFKLIDEIKYKNLIFFEEVEDDIYVKCLKKIKSGNYTSNNFIEKRRIDLIKNI